MNVTLPPSAVRDRSDVRAESGKSKNTGDQPAYISNVAVIYPVFFLLYLMLLKPYFLKEIHTEHVKDYYPEQEVVENIILDDKGKRKIDPKIVDAIEALESTGNAANMMAAALLRKQISSYPQRNRSFHYLPYHTDSRFEQTFLEEILTLPEMENLDLEVYYNGDHAMTEFKIKCYKKVNSKWVYIGIYTPDFLILQRRDGQIHKSVIVETKGEIYKEKFKDKRIFMETEFAKQNNKAFGYERFDYLYLEDVLSESERILITRNKIVDFFVDKNE